MRVSLKCTSFVLMLVLLITSISCFGVSAEEYTIPDTFLYGDVDLDGSVTVRDATAIQKGLADIIYLTAVQKYLISPDGEDISVRNATEIQKFVADFTIDNDKTGTLVNMSATDKFSSDISENAAFDNDIIIVTPKKECENYTYTLEDFPEYEFASIYRLDSDMLFLSLKNPTRECVLEAIKALDYRANLDVRGIMPNYVFELY